MKEFFPKSKFTTAVFKELQGLDLQDKPLALGVSGGVDSMVLLHCLAHFKPQAELAVFHVDHNQHDRSLEYAQFVEREARLLKIPFFKKTLKIPKKSSENILRKERFLAFEELWQEWQPAFQERRILLAHHADDQLETLLFRLMRGMHPDSIGGLASVSILGKLTLIRPFLNISKAQILAFAKNRPIVFMEDPTNTDVTYARNAIRYRLIPLLEELRPKSSEKILTFFQELKRKDSFQEDQLFLQFKKEIEDRLGENLQKVKKSHWVTLKKTLNSSNQDPLGKIVQFPGGLQVKIFKKTLRFLEQSCFNKSMW